MVAGSIPAGRNLHQAVCRHACFPDHGRDKKGPKSHKDMVAAVFRTIFAQPNAEAVSAVWDDVRDQLARSFPKVAPLMDAAKAEVLAFAAFPPAHWVKICRTTRWSGSTRRSNAAPASSGSSPTKPPSSA
jgi:putative transposase